MKDHVKMVFKKGSYLYIEGDEDSDEVFLIESGKIEYDSDNKRLLRFRTEAGPGDIVGFVTALSNRPRMESAYAVVDTRVIIFTRDGFLNLLQKNSSIAVKVINTFAEDLRMYDEMIFSTHSRRNLLPEEVELFNLGKFYNDNNSLEHAYYVIMKYLELYPGGSRTAEAGRMKANIESAGIRKLPVPKKSGIYRIFSPKQIVFCEGEQGDELFIIKEGKVRIFKNTGNCDIMLSILQKGDIFGELAIVTNKPRNATAICENRTVLLPINKSFLTTLIEKSPSILKRIYMAISQRVWFTMIRVESRLYAKPLTRIYTFLENKLLEERVSLKGGTPYMFNFGIEELLKMVDLKQENLGDEINELLSDQNIAFNFGQIMIYSPKYLSLKAKYFRSRDHLYESDEEKVFTGGETNIITPRTPPPDIDELEEIEDDLYNELIKEVEEKQ